MDDFQLTLPDGHGIIGSVDEVGTLYFAVRAGKKSAIRGGEMFDLMMRSFGGQVRAIGGVWRKGPPDEASDNIDEVNRLTGLGHRLEDAILRTWTVAQAKRWGFTRVTLVGSPLGNEGAYSRIDVLIEKETQ